MFVFSISVNQTVWIKGKLNWKNTGISFFLTDIWKSKKKVSVCRKLYYIQCTRWPNFPKTAPPPLQKEMVKNNIFSKIKQKFLRINILSLLSYWSFASSIKYWHDLLPALNTNCYQFQWLPGKRWLLWELYVYFPLYQISNTSRDCKPGTTCQILHFIDCRLVDNVAFCVWSLSGWVIIEGQSSL